MVEIIRGVIFDVDETLVYYDGYSQRDWYNLYVQPALLERGIKLDYSIYRKMTAGELPRSYVERFGINHVKFWKLADALNLEYRKSLAREGRIKAFPDVGTLGELKRLGLKLAAVSNASQECTEFVLNLFGLRKHFDAVYGKDYSHLDGVKPNPYLIEKALKTLGLKAEEALMVGDSRLDIEAGHRAGLKVVQLMRFERVEGADYYAGNLGELLDLLRNL